MKKLFVATAIFVLSAIALMADVTNGVFYIDNNLPCRLISQNGAIETNRLITGKTYMVGNTLLEIDVSTPTTFYFAGGPIIEAGSNTVLSITLFDQEVKNLNVAPRKAEFGSHIINLTFSHGDFSVIYPINDSTSFMGITTPFMGYQLNSGRFFFRITDKSSSVYVLDGMLQVQGDKKDNVDKGKRSLAIPFGDSASGIPDKVITSVKALPQEDTDRFSIPITAAEKKTNNVQFFIVNNRVVGIWMK